MPSVSYGSLLAPIGGVLCIARALLLPAEDEEAGAGKWRTAPAMRRRAGAYRAAERSVVGWETSMDPSVMAPALQQEGEIWKLEAGGWRRWKCDAEPRGGKIGNGMPGSALSQRWIH